MKKPAVIPALLPCPFCGSAALYKHLWSYVWQGKACIPGIDGAEKRGRVACENPGCDARSSLGTEAEAVKLWNRRPGTDNRRDVCATRKATKPQLRRNCTTL